MLVGEYGRWRVLTGPGAGRWDAAPALRSGWSGGRERKGPAEWAAFNRDRDAGVKKRFDSTEVVAGGTDEETIVYNRGTLYGAWPDGTAFEGNRYVDRYVVKRGLIVQMDVWNDSAEWLLIRAGLAPR